MSKAMLGLVLGAALGLIDGLSAFMYPGVRMMMLSIIIGSTVKGLVTGFATGYFQSRLRSLPLGILFGLAVGFALSYAVAATAPDPEGRYYYAEIILPGSALGAIVGYATYRFGRLPQRREPA
jgi:LytS/YehU family sensor histidine kinase